MHRTSFHARDMREASAEPIEGKLQMSVAERQVISQSQSSWGWVRWIMLVALIIAVGVATVAMLGWNSAIDRADQALANAFAAQSHADQAAALQQRQAALQTSLEESQARERALATQLTEAKAALAQASSNTDELATARREVATAQQAAADAKQARDAAEQRLAALDERLRSTAGATAPVQQAGNIVAANPPRLIAPELPLPGLPEGARPRDYLVAAQQAIRSGATGKAQAALERAETRMLNEAELGRKPGRPARHPGVMEIERALDYLGRRNDKAATAVIDQLLTRQR